MAQTAQSYSNTARAASRARREAMSTRGKAALKDSDRTRSEPAQSTAPQAAPATSAESGVKARGDCGCGGQGDKARAESSSHAGTQATQTTSKPTVKARARVKTPNINTNSSRATSLARRQAMSQRGKAGLNGNGMSEAQTARAANPKLTGRELARKVRADRCRNGNTGKKKSEPVGRMRPNKTAASETGAASDAPWKVGQSQTGHGQTLTGSIVGRSSRVTGNEPGTCKNVTGVEYIGADQTEAFCSTARGDVPSKITSSQTRQGQPVSGNNVGRSSRVTGDERGAGRELSGSQYMQKGNGQSPMKVGTSQTLRGGSLTGTRVGRSERVTGDEPGTCKLVTGDDYVGQEQYQGFCGKAPKFEDQKVGFTQTFHGRSVSGTLTGRSTRMTGDEPGTCKSVTGTPYAGLEQYSNYCKPEEATLATARYRQQRSTPGSVMTGIQPGLNGHLTGADKGACEPLSGTPYVGADQFAEACPSVPAEPGSPDFPQQLGETPWGRFSVQSPVHASQGDEHFDITGNRYEQGKITGPFGMAGGKVTGTEEARFGKGHQAEQAPAPMPETAQQVQGRVKSRISGEGIQAGLKITGDDWDRGDRVTGTEGMTATKRNPTRQGGGRATGAMQMKLEMKRNEDIPEPISPVTGGSGNTEKGSLITYSGGARG